MPPPANKSFPARGEPRGSGASHAAEGMPHADEALKTLIARFQAAPASDAFVELAAGLLVRGHAAEALRIAEHGLQINAASADGRVERAAALLALGRPRVAYVELRRALALEQHHRRALRLLGRAYRDAGAPSRAAELLARRFSMAGASEDTSSSIETTDTLPPDNDREASTPLASEPAPSLDPNLFSNLTVDLGLGSAVPDVVSQRRIEITQVIRRKGMPRPPRSASELIAIDGPIVETTHPGQIVESETPFEGPIEPPPIAPLFGLADEPLFSDNAAFEVRPVQTQDIGPNPSGETAESETVVETIGPSSSGSLTPVDLVADLGDLATAMDEGPVKPPYSGPVPVQPLDASFSAPPARAKEDGAEAVGPPSARPRTDGGRAPEGMIESPGSDTPEESTLPVTPAHPGLAHPTELEPPEVARPTTPLAEIPKASTSALGLAAVDRARVIEGRIVVVRPVPRRSHIVLALLGATAMILYIAALALFSAEELAVWLQLDTEPPPAQRASEHPRPP